MESLIGLLDVKGEEKRPHDLVGRGARGGEGTQETRELPSNAIQPTGPLFGVPVPWRGPGALGKKIQKMEGWKNTIRIRFKPVGSAAHPLRFILCGRSCSRPLPTWSGHALWVSARTVLKRSAMESRFPPQSGLPLKRKGAPFLAALLDSLRGV